MENYKDVTGCTDEFSEDEIQRFLKLFDPVWSDQAASGRFRFGGYLSYPQSKVDFE